MLTKKRLVFIPIIILMAVVPLIVFLKEMPMPVNSLHYKAWPSGSINIDFFSYYKSWWIIISVLAAWILFLWQYDLKNGKYNIFQIPIFAYMGFAAISTILSPYRVVALKGVADRYENIMVIFAYLITAIIVMNIVNKENDVKLLINMLIVSSVIAATIGIFQYFGLDFFQSTIGQYLMLPSEKEYLVGKLAFRFGICNIYSTMYNTNYVGSYMVMLLMITFSMYINAGKETLNILDKKDLKYYYNIYGARIIYGLLTLLIFSNLIGCRSRAGIVGAIVALIFLAIIMREKVLKNIGYIILICFMAFWIFVTMNDFGHGVLYRKVSTIAKDAKNISDDKVVNMKVHNIYADRNSIVIDKKNDSESLRIVYQIADNTVGAMTLAGEEITIVQEDDLLKIKKHGYEKYSIKMYENRVFDLATELGNIRFIATDEGIKYYTRNGKTENLLSITEIDRVKKLDGKEKVGTGRVYIWSRTIPLLKSRMIYGSGPDTFSLAFPQNDHIGKLKTFNNPEIIVDKPHNMYLQMAVNTGVMSLVAFLLLMGAYFIMSIKLYFNSKFETYMEKMGAGIFFAMIGYCVAAMFNDSLVSVAPVFWALLGIGIAVNMINMNKDKVIVTEEKITENK